MSKKSFEIEITTQSLKRWYYTTRTYVSSISTYIHKLLLDKGVVCRECVTLIVFDLFGAGINTECDTCYHRRLAKNTLKHVKKYDGMTLETITDTCRQCGEQFYNLPTGHSVCTRCVIENNKNLPPHLDLSLPHSCCTKCGGMFYRRTEDPTMCETCLNKEVTFTTELLKKNNITKNKNNYTKVWIACQLCNTAYYKKPHKANICEPCRVKLRNGEVMTIAPKSNKKMSPPPDSTPIELITN